MSATFSELKTEVSEAIRDPDGHTFDDTAVGRLVNEALSAVGRVMPEVFQDDITPVADTLEYVLRGDVFGDELVPEIEVARVEVWDGSVTPNTRVYVIPPASAGRASDSQAGWSNWGGTLSIPNWAQSVIAGREADYLIRVWGYSPYAPLSADGDIASVSTDAYWAVVQRARLGALERLNNDRTLFTQWQTRSGNSDISPAGLMSQLQGARDEWRRTRHELIRLRALV